MKKLFTFCCFVLGSIPLLVQGQTVRKHFIYFKDKANSPYSVSQPAAFLSPAALARRIRQNITVSGRDLPVNPAYVTAIKNAGVPVLYKSRWFNGVMVSCDSAKLNQLLALPFVKNGFTADKSGPSRQPEKLEQPANNQRIAANRSDYGIAYRQAEMIGATKMHDAGFRGEGKTIAVFDAGFPGVNTALPFAHLYQNNQIKGVYDFVDNDKTVYEKNSHGTQTLSCIGAYQFGRYIGTAYKANFYLFITENDDSEHPVEEFNWLFAAEYADSAGVDIISSSLGYTTFDFPSRSYTYADLNGNTAVATRAADFAAATGILVVNSAGNEGSSGWRYVGAPADGDSVLAVGAVDSLGTKANFSSFGPTADGRIKPNLSAQGQLSAVVFANGFIGRNNGTSFSCPILSGMAAGFWQANPNLTNMQVIQYLQQSASQATNPDNLLGYGIPNFIKAHQLLNPGFPDNPTNPEQPLAPENVVSLFPNPVRGNTVTLTFNNPAEATQIEVKIYDRLGRSVNTLHLNKPATNARASFALNPGMAAGIYFMQVSWGKETKVLRVIKMQ